MQCDQFCVIKLLSVQTVEYSFLFLMIHKIVLIAKNIRVVVENQVVSFLCCTVIFTNDALQNRKSQNQRDFGKRMFLIRF